jgi:NitT/TauT family transport system substrate-binding protein
MLATTRKFKDENPEAYSAVLRALEEANRLIVADRRSAASLLLASTPESGFSLDETVLMLEDPAIKFTTTPENVKKYADFMRETGTVRTPPATWKDMFFSDIHQAPGS